MRWLLPRPRFLLAALAAAAATPVAVAQAQYFEGFEGLSQASPGNDGPDSLIAKGWQFRNQSQPKGPLGWYPSQNVYPPFEGASYLVVDSWSADSIGGGKVSNWAILPAIPNQQAGDLLTVYLRDVSSSQADRLEIRYSPSGNTSTGSSATDVGDFTTVLKSVDPLPTGAWTPVSVTLPGNGRIAFRYAIDFACGLGCFTSHLGVDALSIGGAPPPPCGLDLPGPGQTVTWTAAGNPYTVCQDLAIPEGATLILGPGVQLGVDNGKSLVIDGTLQGQGTASNPVTITGMNSTVTPPLDVRGTADLHFCDVTGRIHGRSTASILVTDCTFPGGIVSTEPALVTEELPFVRVERCQFVAGELAVTDGALAVVDSSFTGAGPFMTGGIQLLRGYLYIDGVTLDGVPLGVIRERYTAPLVIDGVTIQNNTQGPAMTLWGWNYFLGPNNVLVNNQKPVRLTGGLVEGSVVPATGNQSNYVDVGDGGIRGRSTWPDVGVPYVVNGNSQVSAPLEIGPGAEVRFAPGSGIIYFSTAEFLARGAKDDPVRFVRHVPSQSWQGLQFSSDPLGPRLDHVLIEGADFGTVADDGYVQAENCQYRNNGVGITGVTFGILRARGSDFVSNQVGAQSSSGNGTVIVSSSSNPNGFDGNGIAVKGNNPSPVAAQDSWWGDPSGPQTPSNPGGSGDPISGPVSYQPFLTEAPDRTDAPPVVDLFRLSGALEAGTKVILNWTVEDEGPIVKQRIFFSAHGNLSYSLVADDLPGEARSYEWTVPVAAPSSDNSPSFVKVVAIDDKGQEGFDEHFLDIPYTADINGSLTFTTPFQASYEAGDSIDVCYQWQGQSGTTGTSVSLPSDEDGVFQMGGHTGISCSDVTMPWVSTDTARVAIWVSLGAGNRVLWFYGDEFTIRPDSRIGDAPPAVTLQQPVGGQVFQGGDAVTVQWSATDDEGIRSSFVQASYDGGRLWHRISPDLPPTQTTYTWRLPASTGIADVRVRVVVKDARFQNSSDTSGPLQIAPGQAAVCQTDLGFGGPGSAHLSVCGDALATGNTADLLLAGARPLAPALLIASGTSQPTAAFGDTIVPLPVLLAVPFVTDGGGSLAIQGIPGGGGPATVFVQALIQDPDQIQGVQISNALRLDFLP